MQVGIISPQDESKCAEARGELGLPSSTEK